KVLCDIHDPQSGKKIGDAIQMANFLELREGKHGDVVLTVRRPPKPGNVLEIRDPYDEVVGSFQPCLWARLRRDALWITDAQGWNRLRLLPELPRGRCALIGADGREVGELLTEVAYAGRGGDSWFRRGTGYYVRFAAALDQRPLDKLLCLGAALGMD